MIGGQIPEIYTIPEFHGPSTPREFDDNYLLLIKPDEKGLITVDGENGPFKIRCKEDIPKLFPHKYNWTFSRFNEWESFYKFFTTDQLFNLKQLKYVEFGSYRIDWVVGTQKMRLTQGRDPRTSKFLINTAHWTYKDYQIDSLDKLSDIVGKLIWINQYISLNITSPASTTKDLLLSQGPGEFSIYNKLNLEHTKFLHQCYIGPRMESKCLGTIDSVDNSDLNKAYLRALGRCPSISRNHILKVVKDGPYDKDAHPGSGYEIEVEVPHTYSDFSPIPLRWNGHTPYPHGRFHTKVSKPYIDLLNELGDIPYTIVHSIQIVPFGPAYYPFKDFAKNLEVFEDACKDSLYPVNLKALHYPLQGHMLHIHRNITEFTGKIWYETSQDYSPINASAIQGMVACELFRFSQISNAEAIRVDALSGYNLPSRQGYKKEPSGLMTFLTPGLKDKPGSNLYRDLIHHWRDHKGIITRFPMRYGINKSWGRPSAIGRLVTVTQELYPMQGCRDIGDPVGIKKLGELLDRRVEIPIPTIPNYTEGLGPSPAQEVSTWIDDYLRLYPQIPT